MRVPLTVPTTTVLSAGGAGEAPPENNSGSTATGGSTYPLAGRNVTRSGHVFELNDTPAGERVRVRHRSGSQIDMLPDGSVGINSRGRMIMTINNDMSVTIHGTLNYQVDGDVNFNTTGSFNVNATDFNVNVDAVTQNINNSYRTNVGGNVGLIAENISTTSMNASTTTVLGDNSLIVNGTNRIASEGNTQIASGGNIKVSAEGDYDMSSASANMAANSMTVIGATGTIGGEGIIMYNLNSYSGGTVYAGLSVDAPKGRLNRIDGQSAHYQTFHGDLNGTALDALEAQTAGGIGSVTIGTYSNITADDVSNNITSTALPTAGLLSEYLNVSDKGIVEVDVDETNIRNMIRRNVFNGGFSNRNLNQDDIREALRDPANVENSTLINNHIANGAISSTSVHPLPSSVGRVSSSGVQDQFWGPGSTDNPTNPFFATSPVSTRRRFLPPRDFYINNQTVINPSLELMPGVRMSVFLRPPVSTAIEGSPPVPPRSRSLAHITDPVQKRQIARNCQIHAWYIKSVNDAEVFDLADFELSVLYGLYRHEGSADTITEGSVNDLARTGRAITYCVINKRTREPAPYKTFDAAVFLKNFYPFEKLILNYDSFDPSGSMAGSVTIIVPDIPSNYIDVEFNNQIETQYNGRTLSQDELTEVTGVPQVGLAVGLSNDLKSILDAAAAVVPGVTMVTTSGIEGRRNSSSGRHNRGDASDTQLYLNGRLLSVGNEADRQVIIEVVTAFIQIARARGFQPSVGVANHSYPSSRWYMSGTSHHLDISAGRGYTRPDGGRIVAAIWGGSGSTRDVPPPDWLSRAYYG